MEVHQQHDGGVNINFSRQDLVEMPKADLALLEMFIEALAEEYGTEIVQDGQQPRSTPEGRAAGRTAALPAGRYHARKRPGRKG